MSVGGASPPGQALSRIVPAPPLVWTLQHPQKAVLSPLSQVRETELRGMEWLGGRDSTGRRALLGVSAEGYTPFRTLAPPSENQESPFMPQQGT